MKQVVYAQPIIRNENETHKALRDFEIQMDQLISARRPDLLIVNKKENLLNNGFCRPCRRQGKIKRKRNEKYICRPCQRNKNNNEYKGDYDTNYNWCTWSNPQRIGKGTRRLGNKRTSGDSLRLARIWRSVLKI